MTWPENQQGGGWGYPQQGGDPAPRPSGGLSPTMTAALAIVLIAVVIIAFAVVWNELNEDGVHAAPAPVQSSDPASEPSEEPSASPASSSTEPTEPTELIEDDWQIARAEKWGLVYEVPKFDAGWSFEGSSTIFGAGEDEDGMPEVAMSGLSVYKSDPCGEWNGRAHAGAQSVYDTDDTADMAGGIAEAWSELGYETDAGAPSVSLRSVEGFSANGLTGHLGIVDVEVQQHDPDCHPPEAVVYTVAVPDDREGKSGVRAFSVLADQGRDDAFPEEDIERLIGTLRDEKHEVA